MPYTLMKGLVWIALALALGITVGWLLRSVTAHRQVVRAKAQHGDAGELERLRARLAELEPVALERDRLLIELAEHRGGAAPPVATPGTVSQPTVGTGTAEQVLGRPISLDDLKVIDGIGPNVELLCHAIGIRTWDELSSTEVSLLRTMLRDAGPRFRTHDPSTWPEQARLLAEGRWQEFADFGRPAAPAGQPTD
jgi:predicted flap endonuclease-1-like 5' DNA nuclease